MGAEHSMAAGTRGVSAAASDTGSHNEAVAHGSDAHADADGPEAAASSDFKPLDCSAHTDVEALLVRDPDAEEAQPLPPPPPPPLVSSASAMSAWQNRPRARAKPVREFSSRQKGKWKFRHLPRRILLWQRSSKTNDHFRH